MSSNQLVEGSTVAALCGDDQRLVAGFDAFFDCHNHHSNRRLRIGLPVSENVKKRQPGDLLSE